MASKHGISVLSSLLRSSRASSSFVAAPLLRPYPRLPRTLQPAQIARRYAHKIPRPGPPASPTAKDDGTTSETKSRKLLEPHYELTFTCVPCSSRSTHAISKQGYHKGSVLITCPSCRNRHIISDHLNIFGDRKLTIEDLMKERGQLVKRGTLGVDGDIEFWEDGTQTERGASSTTAAETEVADESEVATKDEEVSTPQRTRNPLSSPESSAIPATAPLGASGSRPRLDDVSTADGTPSTRRQFHTKSALLHDENFRSISSRFNANQLEELRGEMMEQEKSGQRRKPDTIEDDDLVTLSDDHRPLVEEPLHFRKTTWSSVRNEIPRSDLAKLKQSMSELDAQAWEPPTVTSVKSAPRTTSGHNALAAEESSPDLLKHDATSRDIWEAPLLFKKIPMAATAGRPNLRNQEARKLMGISEEEYRNAKIHHQKDTGDAGDHSWTKGFAPGRNWGAKNWNDTARMSKVPKEKFSKRTLYAWPEGATEAVKVQINAKGKTTADSEEPFQRFSQHSGKQPRFRKLAPKQKRDKNAPISPDDFMAEMLGGTQAAPQRPLPEETYQRITKGLESARNLPRQKVNLEDF